MLPASGHSRPLTGDDLGLPADTLLGRAGSLSVRGKELTIRVEIIEVFQAERGRRSLVRMRNRLRALGEDAGMERVVIEGVAVTNVQLMRVLIRRFGATITPQRTIVLVLATVEEAPMEITVAMRADRKLRELSRYRALAGRDDLAIDESLGRRLGEDESPIGLYENRPGSPGESLLITDHGLHLRRGLGWVFLSYDEMIDVSTEGGEKLADHLEIRSRDGSTALIPVLGRDPDLGTKDTFSLLMFLQGVLLDRERRAGAAEPHHSPPAPIVPAIPEGHAAR